MSLNRPDPPVKGEVAALWGWIARHSRAQLKSRISCQEMTSRTGLTGGRARAPWSSAAQGCFQVDLRRLLGTLINICLPFLHGIFICFLAIKPFLKIATRQIGLPRNLRCVAALRPRWLAVLRFRGFSAPCAAPCHGALPVPGTFKAPPDERGGNRYVQPTATAPHSDSTKTRSHLFRPYVSFGHPLRT
jgi:hypothetical protein